MRFAFCGCVRDSHYYFRVSGAWPWTGELVGELRLATITAACRENLATACGRARVLDARFQARRAPLVSRGIARPLRVSRRLVGRRFFFSLFQKRSGREKIKSTRTWKTSVQRRARRKDGRKDVSNRVLSVVEARTRVGTSRERRLAPRLAPTNRLERAAKIRSSTAMNLSICRISPQTRIVSRSREWFSERAPTGAAYARRSRAAPRW